MQRRLLAERRYQGLSGIPRFAKAGLSLLIAGIAAMSVVIEATRLFGLLQPLSNFGMLKLDLLQALVWGCLVALIGTPFLLRRTRSAILIMFACLLAMQALLVLGVLYYVGSLNGAAVNDAHLELYPTVALVPLTVGFARAFLRALTATPSGG